MNELNEPREGEQGPEAVAASNEPLPWVIRYAMRKHGLRNVRRNAVIRVWVAVFLVILGCVLCALGSWFWFGALLFVPAWLNAWLAYRVPRWKRDHESGIGVLP